jgi:hypothetical protein
LKQWSSVQSVARVSAASFVVIVITAAAAAATLTARFKRFEPQACPRQRRTSSTYILNRQLNHLRLGAVFARTMSRQAKVVAVVLEFRFVARPVPLVSIPRHSFTEHMGFGVRTHSPLLEFVASNTTLRRVVTTLAEAQPAVEAVEHRLAGLLQAIQQKGETSS